MIICVHVMKPTVYIWYIDHVIIFNHVVKLDNEYVTVLCHSSET